jgi:uncharacterized heparinase superfamily protein
MAGMMDAADLPTVGWRDRWTARRAGYATRRARLVTHPPPATTGSAAAGAALVAGRVALGGGRPVEKSGRKLWDVPAPTRAFEAARQRFDWLDDLAALGTGPARALARDWVTDWFTRQGHGRGPGWTLPLIAARLDRLVAHASWLLAGTEAVPQARMERALARHLIVARARIGTLSQGPDGMICVARLVAAAARLQGGDAVLARAQDALDRLARALVDPQGGVADRNPETLARMICHMADAAQALADAGLGPHPEHARALGRGAPVLRALRHADGGLARFHGGSAGSTARIDAALAALRGTGAVSSVRRMQPSTLPMGYARLARGPVTVIADAAAPPEAARASAHAGTLAFEMTDGQAPLIVNIGSGAGFGPDWQEAARQTASHSTLVLGGRSLATLAPGRGGTILRDGPSEVETDMQADAPACHVVAAHNGYGPVFGLIHARRLDLSLAGDMLSGEDLVSAVTDADLDRFAGIAGGVGFALRFHLHPAVKADLDPDGGFVTLRLPGRGIWHFTYEGSATIRLDPGVYLEKTRPEPASCRQIVLAGRITAPPLTLRWRLTRDGTMTATLPRDGAVPESRDEDHDP